MEQIIRFHYTVPQLLKKLTTSLYSLVFSDALFDSIILSSLAPPIGQTKRRGTRTLEFFFNITFGGGKAPNLASKTGPQIDYGFCKSMRFFKNCMPKRDMFFLGLEGKKDFFPILLKLNMRKDGTFWWGFFSLLGQQITGFTWIYPLIYSQLY